MGFFNRKNTWIKEQGYPVRITGWGQVFPFFLPGEKKRLAEADAEAREMIGYLTEKGSKDMPEELRMRTKDDMDIELFVSEDADGPVYFEFIDFADPARADWTFRLTKDEALQLSRMLAEAAE